MSDESRIIPQEMTTRNNYNPGDVLIVSNTLMVVTEHEMTIDQRGNRTYPIIPLNFDTLKPKECTV